MSADELFDCEAFTAIAIGSGGGFEQGISNIADIEDKREEYASQYERVSLRATVKQADYILILCKCGWLTKDDFPSSHHFNRKKALTKSQAHALIQKGKKRMAEDKHCKNIARERDW